MTEIKPTHVTFEQAKLLKEKGFDEICSAIYETEKEIHSFMKRIMIVFDD